MANFKNTIINDTGFITLPAGTFDERPVSPSAGMIRFNTEAGVTEFFDGSIWVSTIDSSEVTNEIIMDSLVIYLDAGDSNSYPGSGTDWFDLSGNNYDVILQNGPTFVTNPSHFSFDGSNDRGYVKTLNYGGGNTISEMSVFSWIRTTYNSGTPGSWDTSNWSLLDFDRSEVFSFAVNGAGEVQMSGDSSNFGGFSSNYDLIGDTRNNDGNWHYIGFTFSVENQKIIMYVDGQVDKTFVANGSMSSLGSGSTRYGLIGDGSEAGSEGSTGNNNYYDGDIAKLHFYDGKALTLQEVQHNFNVTKEEFGL